MLEEEEEQESKSQIFSKMSNSTIANKNTLFLNDESMNSLAQNLKISEEKKEGKKSNEKFLNNDISGDISFDGSNSFIRTNDDTFLSKNEEIEENSKILNEGDSILN